MAGSHSAVALQEHISLRVIAIPLVRRDNIVKTELSKIYIYIYICSKFTTKINTVHKDPCIQKTNNLIHHMNRFVNSKPFYSKLQTAN